MTTQADLALSLQEELKRTALDKNDENKIRVVSRIRDELSWSGVLEKKADLLNDLYVFTLHYPDQEPPSKALVDIVQETTEKMRKDKIDNHLRDTHGRWWRDPPLPCSEDDSISVLFEDITLGRKRFLDDDEVWPIETVLASPEEPFDDLFMRFRTQANKKHRHPYRPTLSFDAALPDSTLLRIGTEGSASVRDIISKLPLLDGLPKVSYIRNDDDRTTMLEQQSLPIWSVDPWNRTLPSWFSSTPPTWLDPPPPPAFNNLPPKPWQSLIQSYIKVPTLVIPGTGRNVLPSTKTPSLISASIYLIAFFGNDQVSNSIYQPDPESDHVLPSNRLTPPLSPAQARTLQGRPIQFSTEPYPIPDEKPKAKKRRRDITKEKEARNIGYAWGFDPGKMHLHCWDMVDRRNRDFIIDLSVRASESEAARAPVRWDVPRSPVSVPEMSVEWVGLVTLPEDTRVASIAPPRGELGAPAGSGGEVDTYRSLLDAVEALNASEASQVFEVKARDSLLFGDVQLAKGEGEEGFESAVPDVKPGIWATRVEGSSTNSRGDLYLYWVSADSASPHTPDAITPWVSLSTFSVDSGTAGVFARSAFADDGALSLYGDDIEVTLETLVDFKLLGTGEVTTLITDTFVVVVPGGVICLVDDGGYDVLGQRDNASGLVTAIKIVF